MGRTRWRDRVELIAEVGIRGTTTGDMVWDVSEWDEAVWSGLEPAWEALPGSEVEAFSLDRGRRSMLQRNSAGTASIGLVWRDARGGRWSFRDESPLRMGDELRVRAVVDGGSSIPIYRGIVRRVRDGWSKSQFRLTAALVDRLADLGNVDLPEISPIGLGDLTHERILRILEMAHIDPGYAVMGTGFDDSGVVEHASSNFARNLLDEAMVTTESEAGADLFVDRDGRIVFRRAQWWKEIPGEDPHPRWNATRATWSNEELGDPFTYAPLEPGGFGSGSDLDDLRNHVSAARTGGSAITAEDTDSQARYGLRTHQRFDLTCRYDADVTDWAALYLAELAARTQRIDAVASELDPRLSSSDLERYVDLELGDRHDIEWNDGEDLFGGTFHVLGIRLRVDPDHWRSEVDLWGFAGFGLVPAGARWGTAIWGTDTWQ